MLEKKIMLGKTELSNRLVMAPLCLDKSDRGSVSQKMLTHYDERTGGGCIGLAVIEHSFVRADGRYSLNQPSAARDEDVEGLRKLADVIHRNGSRTIVQISHAGAAAPEGLNGAESISPSGISNPLWDSKKGKPAPSRAMTTDDIREIIECFVRAALRVKAAGFDGCMIHSAHGYLLNQFFSPLTNKRRDDYNGYTIEGRTRLHIQIIKAIRMAAGEDFLLTLRLGGCDYAAGGSLIGDAVEAARLFEKAGLDAIDLSGGMCFYLRPGRTEAGYFSDLSSAVKREVSIPVILAGGVKTRRDAEMLLAGDKADLISVGRALAADSSWAVKAMAENV